MWDCWTDLLTHQNPHRQMASEHFWIEISIGLNYWLLVAWMIRASIFEPSPNDPKIGGPRRNPSGAGLLKGRSLFFENPGSVDEQQGFFFGCFGVVASFLALFSLVHFCSFSDCTDNLQKTRDSLYFGGKTRVSRPLLQHNPSQESPKIRWSARRNRSTNQTTWQFPQDGRVAPWRLSWVVKNGQH